jgi:hypothetical protein
MGTKLDDLFHPEDVMWKPQSISQNRAMAVAYIDSRTVMYRLDDAVGQENWYDKYEILDQGTVMCTIWVKIGEEWVGKTDVGGESSQQDPEDRRKAAFSDAFKRAAVKWGIGRYLYRLPHQWVEYDQQKRQFAVWPTLPDWAIPADLRDPAPAPAPTAPKPAPSTNGAGTKTKGKKDISGAELEKRIAHKDSDMAQAGLCQPGDLIRFVRDAGKQKKLPAELNKWSGESAVQIAIDATNQFEELCRQPQEEVDSPF